MGLLINFDICVSPYSKDKIMRHKQAMKTLEYLAAGKPIIVSDVIGKENFLKEGKNCLLYEPENPVDLANKITWLLQHKELKDQMGKKNKELAETFSWERTLWRSGLVESLREMK
jgi:glycosyltransferase involved in cell wall biosynthesis